MHIRQHILRFASVALLVLACITAVGQSKDELKSKQKNIKKELREKKQILDQTKKDKKVSLTQLAILKKQIQVREKLIGNVQGQLAAINRDIEAK